MGLEKVVYLFNSFSNNDTSPAYQIALGKLAAVQNRIIQYQSQGFIVKLMNSGVQVTDTGKSVTRDNVVEFVSFIQNTSFAPTVYANVLNHKGWRDFYGFASRQLKYLGAMGEQLGMAENTVPCQDCRLILPEKLITVDHQRPQAGRADEAVVKVFRALGLAKGGAKGAKGQGFANATAAKVGGVAGQASNSQDDRYSTNEIGDIYLSLVAMAGEWNTLADSCMHNIVNLRPLCSNCNSPTRNLQKYA